MAVDKLVDSTQLDADLTSVANAIRTKGGTSADLAFPAGFVSAIDAIPTGGGGDSLDDFIGNEGDFASAYDIEIDCEAVPGYSFWRRPVKIARFPNATEIGPNMFDTCASLEEVYFDSYIGNQNLGNQMVPTNALIGCTALKKIYAPNCTHYRFSVNNSNSYASLTDVILSPSKLVFVTGDAFRGSKITAFCYPKVERLYNNVFRDCSLLTMVDILMSSWNFEGQVFYNASSLNTLVVRSTTLRALNNISAFTGTPFASGGTGGTLYVPSALVSSYQSASNWSTILGYANNQIKSIESTHTDPNAPVDLTLYCADGTPLPT